MAEDKKYNSVLYMRGPFPPFDAFTLSPTAVRDATILLQLELSEIQAIRNDLESTTGFIDRTKLHEVMHSRLPNEEQAKGLVRFIMFFKERTPQARDLRTVEESTDQWLKNIEAWINDTPEQDVIEKEQLPDLVERLNIILAPLPGFKRQAKAEKLTTVTGQPLEGFELICDIRPVFDEDQSEIEGMIPYTTLRIVSEDAAGLPVAFEVILTEQNVHQLFDATSKAKKKLCQIHDRLTQSDFEIPKIDMTKRDLPDVN